jgi:ankyrin repeat protein
MKYFVKQGIDPLLKDSIGQTALYYAAREGKFLCCKYLLELGSPLNEKDFYQQTPVYYASRENRLEILELFIDNGADIFIEDKFVNII